MVAARQYLISAIRHDANYDKAVTMLALTFYSMCVFRTVPQRSTNSSSQTIELDPNEPYAIGMKANVLVFDGRFGEAVQQAKTGIGD